MTIYLDLNDNGLLEDDEPFTLTDENGFYSFDVIRLDPDISCPSAGTPVRP